MEKESNIVPNLSPRVDRSFLEHSYLFYELYDLPTIYDRHFVIYNLLLHSYLLIHVFSI